MRYKITKEIKCGNITLDVGAKVTIYDIEGKEDRVNLLREDVMGVNENNTMFLYGCEFPRSHIDEYLELI